jgi:hypothetical protein
MSVQASPTAEPTASAKPAPVAGASPGPGFPPDRRAARDLAWASGDALRGHLDGQPLPGCVLLPRNHAAQTNLALNAHPPMNIGPAPRTLPDRGARRCLALGSAMQGVTFGALFLPFLSLFALLGMSWLLVAILDTGAVVVFGGVMCGCNRYIARHGEASNEMADLHRWHR